MRRSSCAIQREARAAPGVPASRGETFTNSET